MKHKGQVVGVLLLTLLACGLILPYVLLLPLTERQTAFLEVAAGMPTIVRLSVLMLFISAFLPSAISLTLDRLHLGRESTIRAALLLLAAAAFIVQVIENAHWLTMLSVSEMYLQAGDRGDFEVAGLLVGVGFKWAHYSHIAVIIGWFFALYLFFFRAHVGPPLLSLAGMAACALHFGGIVVPAFSGVTNPYASYFGIPLAIVTVVVSLWLIGRGAISHR